MASDGCSLHDVRFGSGPRWDDVHDRADGGREVGTTMMLVAQHTATPRPASLIETAEHRQMFNIDLGHDFVMMIFIALPGEAVYVIVFKGAPVTYCVSGRS